MFRWSRDKEIMEFQNSNPSETVKKARNRQNQNDKRAFWYRIKVSFYVILRNEVTKNLFSIDTAKILRVRSG